MIPWYLLEERARFPPTLRSSDLQEYEKKEWSSGAPLVLGDERPRATKERTKPKKVHPMPDRHFIASVKHALVGLTGTHGRHPPHA